MLGTADHQTENWKGRFDMAERKYTAPGLYMTRYAADRAFASTSCTTDFSSSITTYPAQTVYCIIDGSETIFTSGTSGCTTTISADYTYFTTYNNENYFVWYDGSVSSTPPTTEQQTLIDAILSSCGLSTGGTSNSGWHAGTYSFTVTDYYTNSY